MTEAEIIQYIHDAGTGTGGFGGTWIGGYHAEQIPEELGPMIAYLLEQPQVFRNYLEIGAAAGGTAHLMSDLIGFERLHIIDDNGLPKHVHRKANVPDAVEWIGNSQSEECRQAVDAWGVKFDLILIDAGHSYEAVKADTFLGIGTAADHCFFVFHDELSVLCPGVKAWIQEIREGAIKGLQYHKTFGDRLALAVCKWTSK